MEEKKEIVPVNFKQKSSKKGLSSRGSQKIAEFSVKGLRITLFDGASLELSKELLKVVKDNVN